MYSGRGPESDTKSPCFSGSAEVNVQGKGATCMDALTIGDSILTGSGTYSKVYSFGHFGPLEVSNDHLMYVYTKAMKKIIVPAQDIQVGD